MHMHYVIHVYTCYIYIYIHSVSLHAPRSAQAALCHRTF